MGISMNKFSELNECLSGDYSVDYWSDDVIGYASELIHNCTATDWDNLEKVWKSKNVQWQNYLAQILAWGNLDRAVPLLLELLSVDNEEVVVSAADSLREIRVNIRPITITREIENYLSRIALQTKSDLSAQSINIFLEKVRVV
ncbi:MAG: hypothetical protein H7Z37_04365 [Pyrinomonadaceae bacterium]|nr:hypothetical protein [Pyrinomonadaceae bacterium]